MHSIQQIALFVEEATELLQRLEQGLLRLHAASEPSEVHPLFRAAHTIKSNAGILGATECVRLAQWVESILCAVRERTVAPDATLVDILLQSVDVLRQMTHAIASGQANPGLDQSSTLWRSLNELSHRDARFERITRSVYAIVLKA